MHAAAAFVGFAPVGGVGYEVEDCFGGVGEGCFGGYAEFAHGGVGRGCWFGMREVWVAMVWAVLFLVLMF